MRPPDTPRTLLRALAKDSCDELLWTRLAHLYAPLIRAWLRLRGLRADVAEEEAQTALIRLVRSLRGNPYDPSRARFRTYLARIVASVACDRLRADRAREAHTVPLASLPCDALPNPAVAEPWHMVDAQFRMAALEAALETLRRETASNPFHRAVLEACVIGEERPVALARRLGVRPNSVAQVRRRLLARLRARRPLGMMAGNVAGSPLNPRQKRLPHSCAARGTRWEPWPRWRTGCALSRKIGVDTYATFRPNVPEILCAPKDDGASAIRHASTPHPGARALS